MANFIESLVDETKEIKISDSETKSRSKISDSETKSRSKISDFEKDVYFYTSQIPKGKVSTYKLIAIAVGKPKSYRAVGTALSKNENSFVSNVPQCPKIPCHRVINTDGKIGGFLGKTDLHSKSVKTKAELLKEEGIVFEKGKLSKKEMEKYLFRDFEKESGQ